MPPTEVRLHHHVFFEARNNTKTKKWHSSRRLVLRIYSFPVYGDHKKAFKYYSYWPQACLCCVSEGVRNVRTSPICNLKNVNFICTTFKVPFKYKNDSCISFIDVQVTREKRRCNFSFSGYAHAYAHAMPMHIVPALFYFILFAMRPRVILLNLEELNVPALNSKNSTGRVNRWTLPNFTK